MMICDLSIFPRCARLGAMLKKLSSYEGQGEYTFIWYKHSSASSKMNIFPNIAPKRAQRGNCFEDIEQFSYHANVLSQFGNGHISQHHPQTRATRNYFEMAFIFRSKQKPNSINKIVPFIHETRILYMKSPKHT